MPIKYKDTGRDLIHNQTLVEKLEKNANINSTADMMSEIIAERTKMKASSFLDMIGVLTPVTYYQIVPDSQNNYNVDAESPSDIANDGKKYIKINDFKIKLSSPTNFDNEKDEDQQSYTTGGSFIVLPRTIYPSPGDAFQMVYYGRRILYQVTSAKPITYENDGGFECEYEQMSTKVGADIPEERIVSTKNFVHELIGTTYKSVLTPYEHELLKKFQELYKHLSEVFNNLFYDKVIDSYICRNYDYDRNKKRFEDNNNINSLGVRGGIFRGNLEMDPVYRMSEPREINTEEAVYDNLLNNFIAKHNIFASHEGMLIAIEPKIEIDRVNYKRSVFGCLEGRSVSNYRNTLVSPTKIGVLSNHINSYFVGKYNVIHNDKPLENEELPDFFPKSLVTQLKDGKKTDLYLSCTSKVYSSLESMIIETIVRYVYNSTDDFKDRFLYLYERMDGLYEHDISYANIYYLFPLLGFILDQTLNEMYSTNSLLNE